MNPFNSTNSYSDTSQTLPHSSTSNPFEDSDLTAHSPIAYGEQSDDNVMQGITASIHNDNGSTSEHSLNINSGERVYVRLIDGSRIIVPIGPATTITQVQEEALRRARRIGVPYDGSVVLKTTGYDPLTLFDEDMVTDALEDTENQTFMLQPQVALGFPSSPSVASSSGGQNKVYIRWITPKDSLHSSRLRDIVPEPSRVRSTMRLSELSQLAWERLYPQAVALEEELKENSHPELYLTHCHLFISPGDCRTLEDLRFESSRKDPLNIFVLPVGNTKTWSFSSDSTDIPAPWAFACNDRSVATFMTSLKMVLNEINKGRIIMDHFLQVLWEVTHFPPALIAFSKIQESGIDSADGLSLATFAYCFREVARAMVPPWISPSPNTSFHGSRQVFAWLCSLRPQVSAVSGGQQVQVGAVELQETCKGDEQTLVGRLSQSSYVDVSIHTTSSETPDKRIFISADNMTNVKSKILAVALYGKYSSPWDHYFHFTSGPLRLIDHQRVPGLHPADFDNLLETTNAINAFKMVGPLQLANCASTDLPVITLDEVGLVSTYDQEDIGCGERVFYAWNAVKGIKRMRETNPGHYLLQKLEPIIQERRKENLWEVDAWTEDFVTGGTHNPDENIVICVDTSSSMLRLMGASWGLLSQGRTAEPSRLDVVKDVFTNLVTRVSAHKLNTHLGLVTFSNHSNVRINQPLTGVLLNFQNKLDGVDAYGRTAIWDALRTAEDMLLKAKEDNKGTICRIILLTDGENNDSQNLPEVVCRELYENDIVLDAIVIGTDSTSDLFKMAKHTGGYAFAPKSRSLLYQIPMLETVVDIRMRPDIVKVPISNYFLSVPKIPDMPTLFDFPPCRPHANQNDDFIALRDADRHLRNASRSTSRASSPNGRAPSVTSWSHVSSTSSETFGVRSLSSGTTLGASGSARLIHSEVRAMIENQHQYMDVYVSESNMGYWNVVMQGPPGSPYADGTFLLSLDFGDEFPRRAPTARFVTPVLHPNVTKHGKICHPIFDREWTPSIRVYQVLQQLWGMFMSFEIRDAIDPLFTVQFWTNPDSARLEVQQYVQRFASRSRQLMRSDIVGSATSSFASASSPASTGSANSAGTLDSGISAGSAQISPLMPSAVIAAQPQASPTASDSSNGGGRGLGPRASSALASYLRSQRTPSISSDTSNSVRNATRRYATRQTSGNGSDAPRASRRRSLINRMIDDAASRRSRPS